MQKSYETYIHSLDVKLSSFQKMMHNVAVSKKELYKLLVSDNSEKVNDIIKFIDTQLSFVTKAIKHTNMFKMNFLDWNYDEFKKTKDYKQLYYVGKTAYVRSYNVIRMTKKYRSLSKDIKETIIYFNKFVDIFLSTLYRVREILKNQKNLLHSLELNKMGLKSKINTKIYGDFSVLVENENDLIEHFFNIFGKDDVAKISKLKSILKKYQQVELYTIVGIILNLIPEFPVTDIGSLIFYGFAISEFKKIKKLSSDNMS